MPNCNQYFGKVFAHLATAMGIAAVSAEYSDLGRQILPRSSKGVVVIVNIVAMFGLFFATLWATPGTPLKYILFAAFAFTIGQILKPYVERLEDKDALTRTLILASGLFVGMMAVGFYDKQNLLGWGPYLIAGLLGLIITQVMIGLMEQTEKRKTAINYVRLIGLALFAALTAYDIQRLKRRSEFCARLKKLGVQPDYPVESISLLLDFINIFTRMGGGSD
jgi:FtsH-binding integral membrane protein